MQKATTKLRSRLSMLTVLLILYTILYVGFILGKLFLNEPLTKLIGNIDIYKIAFFMNLGIVALFITFIWKYMPDSKKEKTNYSFMILFLGIIGMWIWTSHARTVLRNTNQNNPEL